MEVQQNSSMYAYKDGVMSDDTFSFDNANGKAYNSEARDHWATMGFYTRLNWNYQNVYFLEFSGRYDGSSRFASGNRWGFSLLSLPVMTLPVPTTSSNGACLFHS